VREFRKLTRVCFVAGTLAGLVLTIVQHFTVIPLIETAETYETAAQTEKSSAAHTHEDQNWRPDNGWERTSFTLFTTLLTGIGFAAVLFGVVALTQKSVDSGRGALWGLAAFVCVGLAPALGLPPQPPAVPVAPVAERQLWWIATVVATAIGLWLMFGRPRNRWRPIAGVICLLLPHAIGAPAAAGENVVPAQLLRQFKFTSLAATAIFWLVLGSIGGFVYKRADAARG
jgi:cobalt transporter subunit CbtA